MGDFSAVLCIRASVRWVNIMLSFLILGGLKKLIDNLTETATRTKKALEE